MLKIIIYSVAVKKTLSTRVREKVIWMTSKVYRRKWQ